MGRFSKLDLDASPSRQVEPLVDPWPDLDEPACLKLGDEQYDSGQYEPALISYSKALRFNRDQVRGWVGQVRCLLCLAECREALLWANRGLERCPDHPDLLAGKGLSMVLTGQVNEGMEFLDGAVEMKSPSAWVWLARGQALLHTKAASINARRCFLKAMEASPRDWRVELRTGSAYNEAGLYGEARPFLLSAVSAVPENPLVLTEAGRAHEGLGQMSLAAGYYRRALAVRRDFVPAGQGLARVEGAGRLTGFWRRLRGGR
jgi:tetratricopeptide (TPR) repeat protein